MEIEIYHILVGWWAMVQFWLFLTIFFVASSRIFLNKQIINTRNFTKKHKAVLWLIVGTNTTDYSVK